MTTRYTITTRDGDTVTGYVQGCGGYLREEVRGLERLRLMAEQPELVGRQIFEPSPECVAVDVGTAREIFVTMTYEQRMAARRVVPIGGATVEIDRGSDG